ncbi:hypothetical protein Btru_026118 [Bulinus truncatus]|nr:hypothetical protein Btru_026118 [Bulinus truncatus]
MDNQCITLPTFMVKLCRKFNLFPNERTTILSQADDLQVLQYCLAYHNQQNGDNFTADSKEVLEMFQLLQQSSVHQIEAEINRFYSKVNLETHSDSPAIIETSIKRSETICLFDSVITGDTGLISSEDLMEKTKITKVFCVYQDYKKSSNHWSVLDAYFQFVQCLSDRQTDFFMSLKRNDDIDKLQVDVTDFISLQTKILEVLNSIKESDRSSQDSFGTDILTNVPVVLPKTPSTSQRSSHQGKEGVSPLLSKTPRTPYSPSQKKSPQSYLFKMFFDLICTFSSTQEVN